MELDGKRVCNTFVRIGRALVLATKSDKNPESGFTATSSLPSITRTDLANRFELIFFIITVASSNVDSK